MCLTSGEYGLDGKASSAMQLPILEDIEVVIVVMVAQFVQKGNTVPLGFKYEFSNTLLKR